MELHRHLLADAQHEMQAFRKAWELDPSMFDLIKRIDGDSPGSFGAVWLASMDDLRVAVKILKPEELEMDDHTADEFAKEAEFLMKARHANLVRFFGTGKTENSSPFLVLELVTRGSLRSLLRWRRNSAAHYG